MNKIIKSNLITQLQSIKSVSSSSLSPPIHFSLHSQTKSPQKAKFIQKMAAALRALMLSHSPPLDALVVPSEDYHQVEHTSTFWFGYWFMYLSVYHAQLTGWSIFRWYDFDVDCITWLAERIRIREGQTARIRVWFHRKRWYDTVLDMFLSVIASLRLEFSSIWNT